MTISVSVTGIAQTIRQIEKDFKDHVQRVGDLTLQEAPKFTPVRTGRAQAGWRKDSSDDNFVVYNAVPYAQYLEKPYVRSRQAPRGIVEPTINSVKRKMK